MKFALLIPAATLLIAPCAIAQTAPKVSVSRIDWGQTANSETIALYTLKDADLTVRITNFGARVVSIDAPDRKGNVQDVVLGYDTAKQYLAGKSYFGAIVGRFANRIAKGRFSIEGKTYQIPVNNGANALHGGPQGFSSKLWTGQQIPGGVEMTLVSPDGDMGFPGALTVHASYTLHGKSLRLDYTATTTKPTVVNLSNHTYFNLDNQGRGTILNELLTIPADHYTPIDAGLIPTGQLASVAGTPFDFRTPAAIGGRIGEPNEQLKLAGGYDHNFVLNNGATPGLHPAARVEDTSTGRTLTVTTTQPGLQFYSGNFLDGKVIGKHGVAYPKHAALVLETQHFPDSPNHANFPSTLLLPGHTFHSTTVYTFGVMGENKPR